MIVDNLPAATEIPPALTGDKDQVFFETGWPIGGSYCPNNKENCGRKRRYYLHNHLSMKIMYHVPEDNVLAGVTFTADGDAVSSGNDLESKGDSEQRKRVVRFEIEPYTVRHSLIPDKAGPNEEKAGPVHGSYEATARSPCGTATSKTFQKALLQ